MRLGIGAIIEEYEGKPLLHDYIPRLGKLTDEEFESGKLPDVLFKQKAKLYGLLIAPDRLRQIRKERRPIGTYASAQQVRFELRESEKLFKRYGIPHVDTTEFSIEEISSRILDSTGVERRVRP